MVYFKCLKVMKECDVPTSHLSDVDLNHILGMAKLCGLGFVVLSFAWSPFAMLCAYTLIAGTNELNIYMTMIPPIMAKVSMTHVIDRFPGQVNTQVSTKIICISQLTFSKVRNKRAGWKFSLNTINGQFLICKEEGYILN